MRLSPILALVFFVTGCAEQADRPEQPTLQAISLLGNSLFPPELPPDILEDREARLTQARADFERDPDDADAIIWFGRRTAYLGEYRDAISIYSEGIAKYPDDARFYRHRGHRFISVRDFDRAITDLETAARLVRGTDDQVEPDGLPNARNIPTSTLHSNIWYHLGLAHYLEGDFESALRAYRECMKVSNNPDMLVATSHWLYMTLRRMGRDEDAAAVLEPIASDMDIIENDGYHQLLLMYKGELTPELLLEEVGSADGIQNATLGYGIGNWHYYNGSAEEATRILRDILEGPQWSAFGYIAAEADIRRMLDSATI
jgi:tetratricopeptide (TPR) repeat protein